MGTVRIELDGDYAIVLKEMIHKTTKAVDAVLIKHGKTRNQLIEVLQKLQTDNNPDIPPDIAPIIEENTEAILLSQVVEWSFGKVNQETIDNIPTLKYMKLANEVDRLYTPVPLPTSNLPSEPSLPSMTHKNMYSQ